MAAVVATAARPCRRPVVATGVAHLPQRMARVWEDTAAEDTAAAMAAEDTAAEAVGDAT